MEVKPFIDQLDEKIQKKHHYYDKDAHKGSR